MPEVRELSRVRGSSAVIHRTLSISEVFVNICVYLDWSSLASVVRTSKVLHEPAMRNLWADLPDLVPLVMTFPEDAWETQGYQIHLARALSIQDWTTFLKFSQLVKTVGVVSQRADGKCSRTDIKLHYSALLELCAMRPVLALLPRLRSFKWRGLSLPDKSIPVFVSLIGESVRGAHIDFEKVGGDPHQAVSCVFGELSFRAPALRSLEIGAAPDLSLSVALEGFRSLTIFKCVAIPLTAVALKILVALPTLVECSVLPPDRPSFLDNMQPLCFPALMKLSVVGSVDSYGPFSHATLCPTVTHFDLEINKLPRARDLYRLFYAIRRQFSPQRLEHFKVSSGNSKPPPGSEVTIIEKGVIIRSPHFASVLKFTQLRSFDFSPLWAYQVDDDLFPSMAKAWPQLESLSLGALAPCIHLPGGTTLKALPPLAVHCPNLKSVALHLDASAGLVANEEAPEDLYGELWADGRRVRSKSKVTSLHLQRSPITFPREVAKFLSMVFPGLQAVSASGSYYDETPGTRLERQNRQRKWADVRQYVGMMREAHLDER